MPTTATHAPGSFCWFELHTLDDKAARNFYASLFGWNERLVPLGNDDVYRIQQLQGQDCAAIMKMMPEMQKQGIPSNWMPYVATPNVDASVEKAKGLGGGVVAPAMDVMDQGRMAVIRDPQGAVISLWQAGATPGVGITREPGAFVWAELMTRDVAGAKTFYSGEFAWATREMPGAQGMPYTIIENQGSGIGGIFAIRPDMGPMPPNWMIYFMVKDCDATLEKVKSLGGRVLMPAQTVPQAGRFAPVMDPTGAAFAVLQPEAGM